jgi:uncharacterized RDD family membrane protein YckC
VSVATARGARAVAAPELVRAPTLARVGEALIDTLVVTAGAVGLALLAGVRLRDMYGAADEAPTGHRLIHAAIVLVLGLGYFVLTTRRLQGQTLGKRVMRLRVVTIPTGVPLRSWRPLIGRELLVLLALVAYVPVPGLDVVVLVWSIADIAVACFDREHRAIHDHIFRTRVIADPARRSDGKPRRWR